MTSACWAGWCWFWCSTGFSGDPVAALKPDAVVVIRAFDDIPAHDFLIHSVEEDRLTGVALTGPFAGCYGEPPLELVDRIKPGPGKD